MSCVIEGGMVLLAEYEGGAGSGGNGKLVRGCNFD